MRGNTKMEGVCKQKNPAVGSGLLKLLLDKPVYSNRHDRILCTSSLRLQAPNFKIPRSKNADGHNQHQASSNSCLACIAHNKTFIDQYPATCAWPNDIAQDNMHERECFNFGVHVLQKYW